MIWSDTERSELIGMIVLSGGDLTVRALWCNTSIDVINKFDYGGVIIGIPERIGWRLFVIWRMRDTVSQESIERAGIPCSLGL